MVQSVHEQLRGRIQEHKENRDPAPLELTVGDVGGILSESGVSEEKVGRRNPPRFPRVTGMRYMKSASEYLRCAFFLLHEHH